MATSGTTTFNLDLAECVEEAFERCGLELRTGYDLRTARRSLNLMLLEWANRGINLWTIASATIPLIDGQATYNLPTDTVDIMEYAVRTGTGGQQTDLTVSRISVSTYVTIPNKLSEGRPIQIYVNRQAVTPTVTFWPVPDRSSYYTFAYWYLRRIQDAGNGVNTQDIPFRFLPALIAGLAYHLSMKVPGGYDRMPTLKTQYDEAWQAAADEDREKAPVKFVPRIMGLR